MACGTGLRTLVRTAAAVSTAALNLTKGQHSLGAREKFTDPEDGKFDVSKFLASAYGFVPIAFFGTGEIIPADTPLKYNLET